MRKCVTAFVAIVAVTALASSAMAFEGHAAPEPQCVISDYDPPTNVRTQPNGVIVGNLNNGTEIRIVDQARATVAPQETNGSPMAGSMTHLSDARDRN